MTLQRISFLGTVLSTLFRRVISYLTTSLRNRRYRPSTYSVYLSNPFPFLRPAGSARPGFFLATRPTQVCRTDTVPNIFRFSLHLCFLFSFRALGLSFPLPCSSFPDSSTLCLFAVADYESADRQTFQRNALNIRRVKDKRFTSSER